MTLSSNKFIMALAIVFALALGGCSSSADESAPEGASTTASEASEDSAETGSEEIVTRDNFVRAETDRMFTAFQQLGGGVNTFHHIRQPTPLDQQAVVRMNRDTIYSGVLIDTAEGGTITLPESPDGRYMSIALIDNDHYDLGVIYTPGTHELPEGAGHVAALVRIQVINPNDPAEIAQLNAWQDQLAVDVTSDEPFVPASWDTESLDSTRAELEAETAQFDNFEQAMAPRGEADETQRKVGAACCWGLLPGAEATYIVDSAGFPLTECRTATYEVPKNDAFWSLQVYGGTGFIESENSTLNSSNVVLNPDGTFTAYFGTEELCGDVPNRLDTSEGWNLMMRVYRPDPSVLGGGFVLPQTTVV